MEVKVDLPIQEQIEKAKQLIREGLSKTLAESLETSKKTAVSMWLQGLARQIEAGLVVGFRDLEWDQKNNLRGVMIISPGPTVIHLEVQCVDKKEG